VTHKVPLLPLVVGLWLSAGSPAADPDAGYPRVRAASPLMRSIITDTAARSATVRDLIARLEDTDVIVYVELTASPRIPIARTSLVTTSPTVRYLRIGINASVPFPDVPPMLAHELQHAVEIAEAPGVVDDAAVRRLFRRIGRTSGGDRFETEAARDVEWIVRRELQARTARRD
jgi:hypothetical protein